MGDLLDCKGHRPWKALCGGETAQNRLEWNKKAVAAKWENIEGLAWPAISRLFGHSYVGTSTL